ncbi:MAG TPA: YetF domain-containing protein [Candidatus Saccharimonadales bacterium]|nr:YetF domain-containing protein [Candidatus Saccharimonadales bacterium]
MLTTWTTAWQIVARTGAVYLLVLVGVRLTGKREVGQMTPFDLTLLLLLSNSVQNAMTGPDTSLAGGAVAAIVLLTLNYLIAELSGLNRRFRRMVQGSPSLLIHDGSLLIDHLKKERLTVDEVMRALREHGIGSIGEVAVGVLEVDGSLSFLKKDELPEGLRARHRSRFLKRD